jgi:hypothetical protein
MPRYTRVSNGFSRKLQNYAAATALIISPTTSSKFIVHFACLRRWLLVSQIGSGTWMTPRPLGVIQAEVGKSGIRHTSIEGDYQDGTSVWFMWRKR